MNILIIAKIYHVNGVARAIQMRRVVAALRQYTEHHITLITEGEPEEVDNNIDIINIRSSKVQFPQFKRIIKRLIIENEILKPSYFFKMALIEAKKVISEKDIDVLLTVSTPMDSHIVGMKLKRTYPSIKWVTFFSDIWPTSLMPKPYYHNKLLSFKEEALTKKIILNCDRVITPSSLTVDILKNKYKTHTYFSSIPHCLGEQHMHKELRSDKKGYIVHSGDFQKERVHKSLILAVKELSQENSNFRGLVHIGSYDNSLKKLIDQYECTNFELVGKLSEIEASKLQGEYPIGIIIEGKMKTMSPFMPSKITDAIQLHERIVSITPKNSFLSYFSNKQKGLFSCEYNKEDIKKCITHALESTDIISNKTINFYHPLSVSKLYDKVFKSLI